MAGSNYSEGSDFDLLITDDDPDVRAFAAEYARNKQILLDKAQLASTKADKLARLTKAMEIQNKAKVDVGLPRFQVFLVTRPGWCQVLNYLFHLSNFLGVAFVLSFTMERYISFCWNRNATLRASGASMHRKCMVVTITLVVVVALLYSFLFAMLGSNGEHCNFIPVKGYTVKTKKIPVYALSLAHIIIGFMLLVTLGLDICIMITIIRQDRSQRENNIRYHNDSRSLNRDFNESVDNLSIGRADDLTGMDTCQRSKLGTLPRPLRIIRSRELRRSRSLLSIRSTVNATRMLFAASLTFTLMQLVFTGLQVFQALLFFTGRPKVKPDDLLYNLVVSLYILSLAIGFIVYMLCGHNFREAVKMLVTCQYGRGCAHASCVKRRSRTHTPPVIVTDDPGPENGQSTSDTSAGTMDSVSRYIDDTSHVSVR